ncbi:MAG: siderophore-interacting protein [Pseudomonadota bacterium]
MPDDLLPFESQADLPGVAFAAMRQIILGQAKASGLEVLEDADGRLTVRTAHGLIGLRPGGEAETAGMVAARDPRWLYVMKGAVVQQMQHLMPEVAASMRWTDAEAAGSLPPNFRFATVASVVPLGEAFLRVILKVEDLSSYGDDAIHFRLLQPPRTGEAAWPEVAENGATRWPEGPGAPHKPVYTTRWADHDEGLLATDVYVHEGGRTTDWARENLDEVEGRRRVVGLVGPSGGGLMHADKVFMASDETGFPAVARLLENLPAGARGEVLLEAEHGAACGYPVDPPRGVDLRWLSRSAGERLAEAALAALPRHDDAKIWFAGEREDARRLREAAKAAGREAADLRISGFWRADA